MGWQNSEMPSTYSSLNVHVIFSTKGRAPQIADAWRSDLHAYLGGIVRGCGATAYAVGGVEDHVHMLLGLKTTHCVADLLRETKKSSSSWAAERYRGFAWQEGYGAFSVGASDVPAVKAYIANQEEHHKTISSADEYRSLLKECGIEIDERFFE